MRVPACLLVCVLSIWMMSAAGAGFHVWVDEQGIKHISSVPRHGFDANGELRRAYDPNSIIYQQRRMRRSLAEQAAELEQQRLETD